MHRNHRSAKRAPLYALCLVTAALLSGTSLGAGDSRKATFAAGCFWCVEALYEQVPGVTGAVSGFSGGSKPDPTYEAHDGHTETVEITYDPELVTYEQLVRLFFKSHDPTDARGVEPDFGPSYRPAIFYRTVEELAAIERVKADVQKSQTKPIATRIAKFERFWPADEYHQDFVRKNPDHPYVRNVSLPRVRQTLGTTAK